MFVNLKLKLVKNNLTKFGYISLAGILIGNVVGCQASLITVKEVTERKIGKTVYLNGKVVHLAPFVGNAAYQLEDSTGKIWIVTSQTPPKVGQKIEVKGKIKYQSLPFDEREWGDFYLIELEQLESESSSNAPK